mgnify:CR=1 FL=1
MSTGGSCPARNSASTGIFSSPTACKINWYLPNSSKMKAPEMPGRIMAQMAMAPDSMMNHQIQPLVEANVWPERFDMQAVLLCVAGFMVIYGIELASASRRTQLTAPIIRASNDRSSR